jgi:lysophospholipase L1-like esterase
MKIAFAASGLAASFLLLGTAHAQQVHWARSWSASPQGPTPALGSFAATPRFHDQTIRQIVRLSGGGVELRVRFTNEFGSGRVEIRSAHVAVAGEGGAIQPGSDHVLTFGGEAAATMQPGTPLLSDPVKVSVPALSRLAISIYLPGTVDTCTCHRTAMQTAYVVTGDQTAAATVPGAEALQTRVLLSAVEVASHKPAATIVILGDSITDGVGSTPDDNRRWPDLLAERLVRSHQAVVNVSNEGISGNRIVSDGQGESALARFDRDVLATPGVAYVIVFEGINDIGAAYSPPIQGPMAEYFKRQPGPPVSAKDMIAAYRQLIGRAHAQGVKILGATIAPYEGAAYASAEGEAQRQLVNAWIRTSSAFDAVLDFDAVLRDPAHPARIRDGLHAGDHLHGSDAGYKAIADSVDLKLFTPVASREHH